MSLGGGTKGSSTAHTNQSDPWLTRTNELAFNQLQAGVNQTGGLPAYLQFNPYSQPTQAELDILRSMQLGPGDQGDPMTALESQGLDTLKGLSDPSAQLGKASDLYTQYGAPIVRNDATVAGQGRSGAIPEALASGFGKMALPIMQQANEYGSQYGNRLIDKGPELIGRKMGRLTGNLQVEQYPRMARSEEYMRPLQAIAAMVQGLPYGGGDVAGYQSARGSSENIPSWLNILAGALGGGCWWAAACIGGRETFWTRLYLAQSPRYIAWGYWLVSRPMARLMAWSPWVRKHSTRMFTRWVTHAKTRMGVA